MKHKGRECLCVHTGCVCSWAMCVCVCSDEILRHGSHVPRHCETGPTPSNHGADQRGIYTHAHTHTCRTHGGMCEWGEWAVSTHTAIAYVTPL